MLPANSSFFWRLPSGRAFFRTSQSLNFFQPPGLFRENARDSVFGHAGLAMGHSPFLTIAAEYLGDADLHRDDLAAVAHFYLGNLMT
jgi:hypothetical protein